ncbi:MAG: DUF5752 family protein [Nitrospirota bacterium]|nr:DUF5752 family protein [Nitrospirota bacterium]
MPFEFKQCISILKATGRKAGDIRELRKMIAEVSDGSIFHHTYQYFLKGHILEYTNDFAHWAGEGLEERVLSEHLSNIDPYEYSSLTALRVRILDVLDNYLEIYPEPRRAMRDEEFYFNETLTFTFPTGIRVKNLAEFLIALKHVEPASIYYHFYEARIRLGVDDFSSWMEQAFDKKELAAVVRGIDPFMHSIEGIREYIVEAVEKEVKQDMEAIGG